MPRAQQFRGVPENVARALQRFGAPVDLAHERTARSRLTYDWDYAKVVQPPPDGITVAPPRPRALPLADAVARVAEGDRRPFLILRECWQCGSGAESEIGRKLDNEQTILLAKWFRCVRVSDAVRHADHPLHAMFAQPRAPHLVLGLPGGELVPIESGQPLSALWGAMRALLAQAYDGDADAAVREELQILSHYDNLDNQEKELGTRLDALLRAKSAESAEAAAIRATLAGLAERRRELETREAEVLGLRLRSVPSRG